VDASYYVSIGNTGFFEEDREKIEIIKKTLHKSGYRPSKEWSAYYQDFGGQWCIIRILLKEQRIWFKIYTTGYGESDTIGPSLPSAEALIRFLEFNGGLS